MNIYVDETFIGGKTIFSAIKISNEKIKQCLIQIKKIHGWQIKKAIKATDIRRISTKGRINTTIRTIQKRSKWVECKKVDATQHSPEFYREYSNFLAEMSEKCPNATIYVDNFNGSHKLQQDEKYSFVKSSKSPGVQIADIFLVDKRSE